MLVGFGFWKKIVAAATILFVFTTAGWLILNRNSPVVSKEITAKPQAGEIRPGSNKAVLILADQNAILLNHAKPGILGKDKPGQRYQHSIDADGSGWPKIQKGNKENHCTSIIITPECAKTKYQHH